LSNAVRFASKNEKPIFSTETLRFFRELARHNRKAWMDANRERYQQHVVAPFRQMMQELAPHVVALDSCFETGGRTSVHFSRINRDIRFARDKTPYRTQMYLRFPAAVSAGEAGELYVGLSAESATAGFRIYSGGARKTSALARVAQPRATQKPRLLVQEKKRLSRRYESYWYSMERGEWTKHKGWPLSSEEWKKILAWIVRRKMAPSAATRPAFPHEVAKVFRDLYPLVRLTSVSD
jgi:uncharacterized protein (TIGR02453 family)